jgi:hypothetical protein
MDELFDCKVQGQLTESEFELVEAFQRLHTVRTSMSAIIRELIIAGLRAKGIERVDDSTMQITTKQNRRL